MNTRVRVAWKNGIKVEIAEVTQLDVNQTHLMNGDDGGTWSPSGALDVYGEGIWFLGPWIVSGGKINTPAASGTRITFGDNDFFQLAGGHTAASRDVEQSFLHAVAARPGLLSDNGGLAAAETMQPGTVFALPLRVHDKAKLTQVVVRFKVVASHSNTPEKMPRMRVVAVALDGTKTPLKSVASGADADGWVSFARPASGTLWVASHAIQTWTYTTTTALNTIDRSKYAYWLEIEDESGTNAFAAGAGNGNVWTSAITTLASIADTRPE